jgi:hypothetical protein
LPPASAPRASDRVLVPESYALHPLGRHDALGAKFSIDPGDVNAISEAMLSRDEFGHLFGIIGFVLKVGLEEEALANVWDKAVEGNIEDTTVDPGYNPMDVSIIAE